MFKRGKLLGVVLCLVLSLSVYVEFVQSTGFVVLQNFVEEVSLLSSGLEERSQFRLGDTVVVSARVKMANAYTLNIFDGEEHRVYTTDGDVADSQVVTRVPLSSPGFSAGEVYSVSFQAGLLGCPLPGLSSFNAAASAFGVVEGLSELNLTSVFDANCSSLQMSALLVSDESLPIVNRTVGFYLLPNRDSPKTERGWISLGSAVTDTDGSAGLTLGFDMGGGWHGLEARFAGDADFSGSIGQSDFNVSRRDARVEVVRIEKAMDTVQMLLRLTSESGFPFAGKLVSSEVLKSSQEPSYAITNATGYVRCSLNVSRVLTSVDSRVTVLGDEFVSPFQTCATLGFNGSTGFIVSKWGQTGSGSLLDASTTDSLEEIVETSRVEFDAPEVPPESIDFTFTPSSPRADLHEKIEGVFYSNNFWDEDMYFYFQLSTDGLHWQLVEVEANKTWDDGRDMWKYNATLFWYPEYFGTCELDVLACPFANYTFVAEGNCSFSIARAPANIVVYYPEAFDGASINFIMAFAKSRTYNATSSDFFESYTLAPSILWDNVTYAVDNGTDTTRLHVFVDDCEVAALVPDLKGLCTYQYRLNGSQTYSSFRLKVVSDETSRYEQRTVEKSFFFTKVSVRDVPSAGGGDLKVNYSLSAMETDQSVYLNCDNTVAISASLFGNPICNVSASVFAARVCARKDTNSSGFVNIPSGYTQFRVKSACQLKSDWGPPSSDVNWDGWIDMRDVAIVSEAIITNLTSPAYNWKADVNADGIVDSRDLGQVTRYFGKTVNRTDTSEQPYDYSGVRVDFDDGNSTFLDNRGFANSNSSATRLKLPIGAAVEFLNFTLNATDLTDNLGAASINWNPSETALYVLHVKLPSQLNLTVATFATHTQINATLSFANYYLVANRRPVNLTINMPSEFHTVVCEPQADAYVYTGSGNHGTESYLKVGSDRYGDLEYRSYIRFDTTPIPENAYILSARLQLFYVCTFGSRNSCFCEVRRVTGSWNEHDIEWARQPELASTSSCDFSILGYGKTQWMFLDVTQDVRFWHDEPALNYGFVVEKVNACDYLDSIRYFVSREFSEPFCYRPCLEVSYFLPSPSVSATAFDSVSLKPLEHGILQFKANGVSIGNAPINSGTATLGWQPSSNAIYNVTVSFGGAPCYAVSSGTSAFDFRWPTNLTSCCGDSVQVGLGADYVYGFDLNSTGLFGVNESLVKLYINGTYWDGATYRICSYYLENTTSSIGQAVFAWAPPGKGTFSLHAVFEGNASYLPSETYVTVTAYSVPFGVLFTVTPSEFEPGATLGLNATLMDVSTNLRLTGYEVKVEFLRVNGNNATLSVANSTSRSDNGEALSSTEYPNDGYAYAYFARIVPEGVEDVSQCIASNPVQLTCSTATKLLLNVTRDYSSSNHVIAGRLVNTAGQGISDKQITIQINGTDYASASTNGTGYFDLSADLQPKDLEATLYTITASYGENSSQTATAWTKTLDGQDYPACTTIQCGFEPSSNSTSLTVTPQATAKIVGTKTPEEMQKEAEDDGTLKVWHEFSWWYPWYRMHIVMHVNPTIDVGFNPIFPGGETWSWNGLEFFGGLVADIWEDVVLDFMGVFIAYVAAKGLSLWNWAGGLLAEGIKGVVQYGLFFNDFFAESAGSLKMLAAGVANILMGLVALATSVGEAFVKALEHIIFGPALSAMMLTMHGIIALAAPLKVMRTPVDYFESFVVDFPIAILALLRYGGWI